MTTKKVYLFSFGAVVLASVYPIYMGAVMLLAFIKDGGIDVADYPRYVIPYTPICVALIICTALLPLVFKLGKKFAFPALSSLGIVLFLGAEIGFEQIAVFTNLSSKMKVETWQLLSCIATPRVKESLWDSLNIRYDPSFKMHFYAIALLIILVVLSVIYGFYKMAHTQNFKRKKPLVAQLISVIFFIGLCMLACFTAFFRTGNILVSPLSAVLMTMFFLVFGVTAGVYVGTCFYEKKKLLSIIIPSIAAMVVTLVMYIGEMVMMDWALFQLGNGFLFEKIGVLPFALIDMITILASGAISYFILMMIRSKDKLNT